MKVNYKERNFTRGIDGRMGVQSNKGQHADYSKFSDDGNTFYYVQNIDGKFIASVTYRIWEPEYSEVKEFFSEKFDTANDAMDFINNKYFN
jgi:hypothetical protein